MRWLVAGKKGLSTLRFRGDQVDASWTGFADQPGYADAQAIAHRVAQLYIDDEVDRVVIVYNQFESPLVQRVVEQELLPVPEEALQGEDERRTRSAATSSTSRSPSRSSSGCCPPTSRRRSTARCSSRPRPTRARR